MATSIHTLLLMALYLVPDSMTMSTVKQVPKLTTSKYCYGRGYCFEKPENYPQAIIDKLVQKMNMTFNENNTALPIHEFQVDENDCDKKTTIGKIYEIMDNNGVARVLVQSKGHINQLFEVEECMNPGHISKPSVHFSEDIVSSFNLQCQQMNLDVSFLVLNIHWTGLELVKGKRGIPVACNCVTI